MLSSTRATARTLTVRASSPFAQALPAESSRQGLLRAIARQRQQEWTTEFEQQRRTIHHRRRNGSTYSTAVAYAEEDRADHLDNLRMRHWPRQEQEAEHTEYRQPRPPDRAGAMTDNLVAQDSLPLAEASVGPLDAEEELATVSPPALVELIHSDPVHALRQLPLYPPEQLSQLTARQLTDLLKNLYKVSRSSEGLNPSASRASMQRSLAVLRNLLHDLPSSPRAEDQGLGKRFRRDLLSRFLRACAMFDCDDLLRDTIKERLIAQRQTGQIILQPDMLATELAARRRWELILDLFSPSRFPVSSITAFTIQRLMQAHLGLGRTYELPSVFNLYASLDLEPTPRAYSLLVQAHLALGDIDSARQVMRDSAQLGTADGLDQQLAILKGHRGLGRDEAMEQKVLEMADGLEVEQKVAIFHAVIRTRLDSGDDHGAQSLLERFHFESAESHASLSPPDQEQTDMLTPNAQTYRLAFRAYSPTMSLGDLQYAWQDIVSRSPAVTDEILVSLFDALARLGRLDIAFALAARGQTEDKSSDFALPDDFRPGLPALNALLRQSSRLEGFAGFERTIRLFSALGVEPDSQSLHNILDFVRDSTTSDPTTLANLLRALLREFPNLKATSDHIDLLLSQAVRAKSRNAIAAARQDPPAVTEELIVPADIESQNAQAGLKVNDPFKKAMAGIIQSLHARGARSVSRSLATRLRFDAHSGGSVSAVQTVWDDMLARGFRPDKRHLLALMKGYAESGHMRDCEDVILLAKETGVEVTRGMWMVIMTGYGRRTSFDLPRAEKAFHAIRRSEQGLDPAAICAMIGIYLRAQRRYMASHLALQLVANLVPSVESTETTKRTSVWSLPSFPAYMLNERVIAIATDALRLDHPQCALEVISAKYPSTLPIRVRQVVKSIRSRARARTKWNIANADDHDVLTQAEEMLKKDESALSRNETDAQEGHGRRKIGPKGMKKRILRLFERRNHRGRGNGGRKVISAKEERRQRHEAISNASQTLA